MFISPGSGLRTLGLLQVRSGQRKARAKKAQLKKSMETEEGEESPAPQDPRDTLASKHPQLLVHFSQCVLFGVIAVFTSSVSGNVRHLALSIITKILAHCTPDMLRELLRSLSVSSFIANLLSSPDPAVVATALQMSELLMQKLPDIFEVYFKREGVLFEVQRLAAAEAPQQTGEGQEEPPVAKAWIREHSQALLKDHFGNGMDIDDDANVSEELRRLKVLSSKLRALSAEEGAPASQAGALLAEVSSVVTSEEGLSTFEFLRSNVVQALLSFLSAPQGAVSEADKRRLLLRGAGFCRAFFDASSPETVGSTLVLLRKLHHALNKLERFPVLLNEVPGTAAGLKYLTQPFKIKLVRGSPGEPAAEGGEREGEADTVLVEPLASVGAIRDFLASRLRQSPAQAPAPPIGAEDQEEEGEEAQDIAPAQPAAREGAEQPRGSDVRLYLEGKPLPANSSVFSALQAARGDQDPHSHQALHLWEAVHTISYSVREQEPDPGAGAAESEPAGVLDHELIHFLLANRDLKFDYGDGTDDVLSLIRILHGLNELWPTLINSQVATPRCLIPPVEFVNNKVAAKVMRQLSDPLSVCSGSFPLWCRRLIAAHPFLFPFESRKLYFTATSFGIARSLQALSQHAGGPQRPHEFRVGRIQRQKVRISRERVLDSAVKVMQLYGTSKAILEVEYFDEVGTGLGPTLEFYTLASRELQRKDIGLWRDDRPKEEGPHVYAPNGLFPRPIWPGDLQTEDSQQLLRRFWFVGRLVAKSMLDSRILDLPLSVPFLKWMLGKALTLEDLRLLDHELAASLDKMLDLCRQKAAIEGDPKLGAEEKESRVRSLRLGTASVEDLDLDFTLSGRPEWELKPQGASTGVTIHNLGEYLSLVVKQHVQAGVQAQLDSFKRGFDEVFPMENLRLFNAEELRTLICGTQHSKWDMQTLLDNTRCDHGYTHNSKTVQYLLEIMTELTPEEQRKFLLFVTGSPTLPLGGFKALEPKLTIVRRDPGENSAHPDSYLPSVNCCFYYLKLPEYSSKEVLKERLLFSIENGQGSFSFN